MDAWVLVSWSCAFEIVFVTGVSAGTSSEVVVWTTASVVADPSVFLASVIAVVFVSAFWVVVSSIVGTAVLCDPSVASSVNGLILY